MLQIRADTEREARDRSLAVAASFVKFLGARFAERRGTRYVAGGRVIRTEQPLPDGVAGEPGEPSRP